MRIGIFTDCYLPSVNGVVSSIESFRSELEKRGHKVFIFCPDIDGALKQENVFRLPSIDEFSPKDFPLALPFLPIINKTIKPLKLDLIHTNNPFFASALGHRAARKLGIAEVHTYHTHLTEYSHYVPIPLVEPIVKFGLKQLARHFCNGADVVIAPSQGIKDLLVSYGVEKPIMVNPTGIDIKLFHHLEKKEKNIFLKKYGIPVDKKILLFAGRLAKEKNLYFLLKCFQDIAAKFKSVHLIIAGGGAIEKDLIKRIQKAKLKDYVTITGYLKKEELAKFYGAADVFTFPSVTETQGLVISEAMAAGTPAVAINVLGPKDLIADGINGYLTRANKKEFCSRILKLLRNEKLRQEFSLKAKESAPDFSIEKRTDKLLEIYKFAILENDKRLPWYVRLMKFVGRAY